MTNEFASLVNSVKRLPRSERGELMRTFFDDPELREDMLDLAALMEAEAEKGERIDFDDYIVSRRPS
jgi:hypothetical protein